MGKYAEIFGYFRQCPSLADLWSIGAVEEMGNNVILPQGASPAVQYDEQIDVAGNYSCEIIPFPSVYEDFQINCYRFYDNKDSNKPSSNINVLTIEEVQEICDWIKEQNENGNLPNITGKEVVSIECIPFVPQIRYVNTTENSIAYFITVRIRYVNNIQRRTIEYGCND